MTILKLNRIFVPDFNKLRNMEKVVVGLSGGVDSFVTALLLQQQGLEVIGVHLQLWDSQVGHSQEPEVEELCKQTGIKLYRLNGRQLFQERVVQPFIQGYLSGITPNPCATCNSFIKWNLLRDLADELNIRYISTGHYIRVLPFTNHDYVHKGIDPNKDQSYFLWGVPEEILHRVITPLGDYTKTQVKEIARTHGFTRLAEKQESMSICFLEKGDYRNFIARQPGTSSCFTPGWIVDESGNPVGEHTGTVNYTVGQKKGIPLKGQTPQYVSRLSPSTNQIVVGDKTSLFRTTFSLHQVHLIDPEEILSEDIEVKVRGIGLNPEGFARLSFQPDQTLHVQLSSPAWAVAPGQPAVFYRQDRVIGGGIVR